MCIRILLFSMVMSSLTMLAQPRRQVSVDLSEQISGFPIIDGRWNCPRCTLENAEIQAVCEACSFERPQAAIIEEESAAPVFTDENERGDEGEIVAPHTQIDACSALAEAKEEFFCYCCRENIPAGALCMPEAVGACICKKPPVCGVCAQGLVENTCVLCRKSYEKRPSRIVELTACSALILLWPSIFTCMYYYNHAL